MGTITDDDPPAPAPSALSVSDAAAVEGGTLRFQVTLTPAATAPATVGYRTAGGTAVAGTDYEAASGTLTFAPGTTRQTIEVSTREDEIDEPNEQLTVTLSAPSGATLKDAVGLGTITDDDDDARRIRLANRAYLPEMGRAVAFNAVKCRIDQARSRPAPASLKQALNRLLPPRPTASARTRTSAQSVSLNRLLGRLSFAVQSKGGANDIGRVAAWSCGDYRGLADGARDGPIDWNGELADLQIGADVRLRPDLLAGLAVSRSSGSFRYNAGGGAEEVGGKHELRLTGIHPYLAWSVSPGLTVWGTIGHAWGELDIADDLGGSQRTRNAALGSGMLGVNGRLFAHGRTTVTLKGEAGLAQFDIANPGAAFGAATSELRRLKFAVESAHERPLPSGGTLTPWGEIGLRHDGGDGKTGTGLELGGGLRYRDPATGWTAEGFGRRRMVRGDTLPREWGFGAAFRIDPDPPGLGLSSSLTQSWGQAGRGVQGLWEQDEASRAPTGLPGRRLEFQVGYGFGALRGRGVLTPYGAATLGPRRGRSYRWGGRLEVSSGATLSLEAERREPDEANPDHSVMLRGEVRF